ncbi:60 kDa heat shock protein, mitochondrial [Halyomorpha halys]|uniref:60 kDa heat shock protein, mitochondrial n=1 Tax=Halyomorpha halys TaxID=286706 RepID=UPI0006D4FEF7|nr:60 kDa heat shock protein, mitochondrial [Halyomorpha halys]
MNRLPFCLSTFRVKSVKYFSKTSINRTEVKFGAECRQLMMEGLDILADAVAITLGPKGRNVILEQYNRPPKITKDGVTVSESIDLKNRFQNIGVKLLQEVAKNTNKKAGDGTSTATVLARSIAKEGLNRFSLGCNPIFLKQGVDRAVQAIEKKLEEISKPVLTQDEIAQIATISANGDKEIGRLIADAMFKVGRHGVILINAGRTLKDKIEVTKGMHFDKGYISPYFVNTKKSAKVEYRNPYILFCEHKISEVKPLVKVLELVLSRKKPLVIIAEDIEGDALTTLVINRIRMGLEVCAVKSPGFGETRTEILKDMAILTGGEVIGDEAGIVLDEIAAEHFGQAGEVIITKGETFIIKGRGLGPAIKQRIAHVDLLISRAKNDFIKEGLEERKARLDSGVAIIYAGGYSEWDVSEKKDRMTDALNATRAAVAEGIVPGGGTALLRCLPSVEEIKTDCSDVQLGIDIVKNALKVPCLTIAKNAGVEGSVVVNEILKKSGNIGYNALTGEYTDLVSSGVVDPTKVVKAALRTAATVATLFTTTEAVIADTGEKKKEDEEKEEEEE